MSNFRKINVSMGWIVFLLSLIVYLFTLEPSASLWDCGEFIATSYKMEIGHPPGAPLFMMINRFFTLFASDVTQVAWWVNLASATASALTISFLYWTIVHLALKLIDKTRFEASVKDTMLVCGSGFVGAMAYAFTDTFWFSAVEGEVYAQSSLFTALVFWAMLKWEGERDSVYATRWLILISYLMGLSIGVHLLNLLSIPALVMIYYYKMNPQTTKIGWWKAFAASVVLLGAVLFVVIPKSVALGAWFDKLFVNSFGLPINTGLLFFVVLLLSLLGYAILFTHRRGMVLWNKIALCLTVLMVGYGTYASVIIRSSANPPMNSNHPDDAYTLLSFLGREQYGATPRVYGPYYESPLLEIGTKDVTHYDELTKKYVTVEANDEKDLTYADGTTTLFPRMHSNGHKTQYLNWVDVQGKKVRVPEINKVITIPTFAENLEFFFKYQINYMYWRYFLWNFVGRQSDVQGDGTFMKGNWISGITPIDELYIGTQDNLPAELRDHPSRNQYYFLPFLLGIAGIVFQLTRKKNDFVVVSFLFFMTGLAIVLYLNQDPGQVRERDYAYAGSFYAFSIWIGLGVFWLDSMLRKAISNRQMAAGVAVALSLSVPTILLAENWDDHDRSHRYIAPDFGYNYLSSTLPNTIYLPYGDNDTFGPWFSQEVEGTRPDVRVCNLSYLQSNWYALQMRYKYNDSAPIDFTIPASVYGSEANDRLVVVPLSDKYTPVKDVLEFIALQSPQKQQLIQSIGLPAEYKEIFPADKIAIPVNKQNALKAGIIKESDLPNVVDTIYVDIKSQSLSRDQYLLLDMIATANWTRPISVTQTSHGLSTFGLNNYLQYDGFTYRLVPIKTERDFLTEGKIDSDYLYNKVMKEYRYGGISNPKVHLDSFAKNYIRSTQIRNMFARLAIQLASEGKQEKGSEVILRGMQEIPFSKVGYDYFTPVTIEALKVTGNEQAALELLNDTIDYYMEYLAYFSQFDQHDSYGIEMDLSEKLQNIYLLYQTAQRLGYKEQADLLNEYAQVY